MLSSPGVYELGPTAYFTITGPYNDTSAPITVNFNISGSAFEGADFAPMPRTATIEPGTNYANVPVVPKDDLIREGSAGRDRDDGSAWRGL